MQINHHRWRDARTLPLAFACALCAAACRGPETFSSATIDAGSATTGSGGAGSGGAGSGGDMQPGTGGDSSGAGGTIAGTDAAIDQSPSDVPAGDDGPSIADAPAESPADVPIPMDAPVEAAPSPMLDPGLVGYWRFDEGTGIVLHDSSTSGNNANTVNVVWAAGAANLPPLKFPDAAAININGGYAFPGTAGLPPTNGKQTISVWALLRAATGGDQYIVCLWSQAQSKAISLGVRAGQLSAWKWGPVQLVGTTAPAVGGWHHLAYTYDGTTHRLYLDGRQVDMSTAAPDAATLDHAQFGAYAGGSLFNGLLDDLRIYDVALSAAQIARLAAGAFNAGP